MTVRYEGHVQAASKGSPVPAASPENMADEDRSGSGDRRNLRSCLLPPGLQKSNEKRFQSLSLSVI